MRSLAVAAALACASLSFADRLILAPVAKKIPLGVARLEHLFDGGERGRVRSALGMGLTEAFDAEVTFEDRWGRGQAVSLDFAYNHVPPIVDLSPGLSIGVRDLLDQTADGRFFYVAVTQRFGQSGRYTGDSPAEVTLGSAFDEGYRPFTALMLPLRSTFRILAEYDTKRVSAGIEYRPIPDFWVRWIHRQNQSLWSLTLQQRF